MRFVALTAALTLVACAPATPTNDTESSSASSAAEADRIADFQKDMERTVPEGSMLAKSTAEWQAYHNAQPDQALPCDAEPTMGSTEVLWVGENHAVLKLLCLEGAYQSAYVFYNVLNVGPQETVAGMSFDEFDDEGNRTRTGLLAGVTLDRPTKVIRTLNKQRGASDCGTAATYEWRDDIGGFFDLVEFRQKLDCDGKATDFPVIFTRGEKLPAEGQMQN